MERQKPHKKLELWGKVIDLVVFIYDVTKSFPREEEFGLKVQLRRAAVSAPSNISEGLTRRTKKDKLHFLNIAQVEISRRLGYISVDIEREANDRLSLVERMLSGLINHISS